MRDEKKQQSDEKGFVGFISYRGRRKQKNHRDVRSDVCAYLGVNQPQHPVGLFEVEPREVEGFLLIGWGDPLFRIPGGTQKASGKQQFRR